MLFSDVRLREIDYVVHHVPQIMHFDAKNRPNHFLGIQLHGRANHILADRELMLSENCIYFFNQEEDYHTDVEVQGLAFSVHFTTFEPIQARSFCLKVSDHTSILRIMDRIDYLFGKSAQLNARIISEFYSLLSVFEDCYYKKYLPGNHRILAAREYINLHFREKDCIECAVQNYGISRRRFNDLFRESFQITPGQYVIDRKISHAKKLLASGEMLIGQIAEQCGFSDVYYFSNTFKREVGMTPSAYRDSC